MFICQIPRYFTLLRNLMEILYFSCIYLKKLVMTINCDMQERRRMSLEIVPEHRGCLWVSVDAGFQRYEDVLWDATKETSCIKMK